MNNWSQGSFYNRWLRSQAEDLLKDRSTLTICIPELLEQESVLETIQKYAKRMNTGKVKIEACPGTIKLSVSDSEEMST